MKNFLKNKSNIILLCLITSLAFVYTCNTTTGSGDDGTTPTDTTAPTVVTNVPENNGLLRKGDPITITFNEDIQQGTGSISLVGTSVGLTVDVTNRTEVTIDGKVLTINPILGLANFVAYTLTIPAGVITDLAGNPNAEFTFNLTTTATYTFRISDTIAISTMIGSVAKTGFSDYSLTSCTGFAISSIGAIRTSAANPTAGTRRCTVSATSSGATVTASVNIIVGITTCTGTMLPANNTTVDLGPTDESGNYCGKWVMDISTGATAYTDQFRHYKLGGLTGGTSYMVNVINNGATNLSICHRATPVTNINEHCLNSGTDNEINLLVSTTMGTSSFMTGAGITTHYINLSLLSINTMITVTVEKAS